jgi:hypothetical protein
VITAGAPVFADPRNTISTLLCQKSTPLDPCLDDDFPADLTRFLLLTPDYFAIGSGFSASNFIYSYSSIWYGREAGRGEGEGENKFYAYILNLNFIFLAGQSI